MSKYTEIYGVDISKDVFDVYGSISGHQKFKNDEPGFRQFKKLLTKGSLVVMEATGYYHYRLAQYLYANGVLVSVVNPLAIKRFIQMKLAKVKQIKAMQKLFVIMHKLMKFHYIQHWMRYRVSVYSYFDC